MKVDDETIRWLQDEAREEKDERLVGICDRALEGDEVAVATCEETVLARVARAHREHRSYGHT